MKCVKDLVSIVLSLVCVASVSLLPGAFAADDHRLEALTVSGEKIFNESGEEVRLRGVNLGGWLIQEDWFCPTDNQTKGEHFTLETLIGRFGAEKAYELYDIYWDNWITDFDFAEIKKMGFNCVRIPFWYRNFQSDDNGTWITDAQDEVDFSRLDTAVAECREHGLYAILDLHGANGCQGAQDHCGLAGNCHFFDKTEQGEEYRRQALEIWTRIAERYAGEPAIAAFDILNEPLCDVPRIKRDYKTLNKFYDDVYHAVREKDPGRILCMMGTWDLGKLPDPKKAGWTNVIYQLHLYNGTKSSVQNRIDASKALGYDVPIYVGEFHPTGDNVTLTVGEMLDVFENEGVNWTVWTWKGYNSWAAWADWFIYGSVSDEMIVDPENDSYELIAEKWGSMATDGGLFYSGHLDEEVLPFLPDGKPAAEEPEPVSAFVAFFRKIFKAIRIAYELFIDLFV